MQNFRENKAYRLSLYLLLLMPVFAVVALLLDLLPTSMSPIVTIFTAAPLLGFVSFIFIISIPILFLGALSFRFISMDPFKNWMDLIFFLLAPILEFLVLRSTQGGDKCGFYEATPIPTHTPYWTPGATFDSCSPYNIFGEIQAVAGIFLVIALVLATRYLISDIRRKRATINTI